MTVSSFRPGGIIVFWSAGESDYDSLKSGLSELGYDDYAPEKRTDESALKDALQAVYASERVANDESILVRPLNDRKSFEVLRERRGISRNIYDHLNTASIDPALTLEDSRHEQRINNAIQHAKGRVSPVSVTQALVGIVEKLRGTPLRPRGALYWLPERNAEIWGRIAKAFEAASHSTRVYSMGVIYDADMCRAVVDAITNEVTQQAEGIEKEIQTSELGERALEGRKKTALRLSDKVKEYESILGASLGELKSQLERVEAAAATAIMLQAASESRESAVSNG